MSVKKVSLDKIRLTRFPNMRPIEDDEELASLVESVKQHGVLAPLLVTGPTRDDQYDLIFGFRRFEACQRAGLKQVPVIVQKVKVEDVPVLQLVENLQRKGVSPMDEARTFQKLREEHNMKQEDIAKLVGRTRAYVAQRLGLLKLIPEAKEALEKGSITFQDARDMVPMDADSQRAVVGAVKANEAKKPEPQKPADTNPGATTKSEPEKSDGKPTPPTKPEPPAQTKRESQRARRNIVENAVGSRRGARPGKPAGTLEERLTESKRTWWESFVADQGGTVPKEAKHWFGVTIDWLSKNHHVIPGK